MELMPHAAGFFDKKNHRLPASTVSVSGSRSLPVAVARTFRPPVALKNFRYFVSSIIVAVSLTTSCAHRVTVKNLPGILANPTEEIAQARADWRLVKDGGGNEETRKRYNDAVARIIQHAELSGPGETPVLKLDSLTIPLIASDMPPLGSLESIHPSDQMLIAGFRERVTVDGVGAPLVLGLPPEGYSPSEGRFLPATATLDFSGPGDSPKLRLHDTLSPEGVEVHRADFTAPIAARFAAEDRQLISLPAMLRSDKFDGDLGLSRIDTTYAEKVPVVFVHGLKSTPSTWRDVMNELRADPLIRRRYEFWTFGYTTGSPIPYSAMKLREALKGMATYRELQGARTDDVVLIGHSMGGLLSRLMTERSGDEVWFEFFNEPVDELPLPPEKREVVRNMAYFEPLPFVRRVVFIATPHGGSEIADDVIGRVFSGLIQLPTQLLTLSTTVLSGSLQALTPTGRAILAKGLPTSIDQLESNSELLLRLKAQPLNPRVIFHSIIGDRGLGTGPDSSDGVVPYTSAHLEGVASEKIVPSGHRAHHDPATVIELRRILRDHLGAGSASR